MPLEGLEPPTKALGVPCSILFELQGRGREYYSTKRKHVKAQEATACLHESYMFR